VSVVGSLATAVPRLEPLDGAHRTVNRGFEVERVLCRVHDESPERRAQRSRNL
jgi:hypothetical protein